MDKETLNKIKNIQDRVKKRKLTKTVKEKQINPLTGEQKVVEHEVVDKENLKKAENDLEDALKTAFWTGELDKEKAREEYNEFMKGRK